MNSKIKSKLDKLIVPDHPMLILNGKSEFVNYKELLLLIPDQPELKDNDIKIKKLFKNISKIKK